MPFNLSIKPQAMVVNRQSKINSSGKKSHFFSGPQPDANPHEVANFRKREQEPDIPVIQLQPAKRVRAMEQKPPRRESFFDSF